MSRLRFIVLIVVATASMCSAGVARAAWPPQGQSVRVPVSRDTWVSSVEGEDNANLGAAPRLKTKSFQEFSIVDFDPRDLAGRVVTGATLHLRRESQDIQRRLTVSTLSSDWVEGTAPNYQPQPGSACFNWSALDKTRWAYPGSDLTAVMAGVGNTLWRFAEATPPDERGWQVVAVEPSVIAARVAGLSYGFVIFDDVGSEYERKGESLIYHQFPNRFLASREAGADRAPYFTVYLGAEDRQPPVAVGGIRSQPADLPPGEGRVTWETPKDAGAAGTLGFKVRISDGATFSWDAATPVPQWLVPLASKPGQAVNLHLRDLDLPPGGQVTVGVRAVDAAGNLGPVSTARVRLSDRSPELLLPGQVPSPFNDSGPLPRLSSAEVFIIDLLDKVQPVTGEMIPPHAETYRHANHLWSAAQKRVRLQAGRNEFVAFQIVLLGRVESVSPQLNWEDTGKASPSCELLRFRYVMTKRGPLPDPLVPLISPISVPSSDETIEGQQCASLLADVYVPHETKPGKHNGTLTLRSGNATLSLRVELNVWNFTLPDYLSFIPEMNCYGLPEPPRELAYYRLAHIHRTCLNRLPYNWGGRVGDGLGPKATGETFDWEGYDQRFGPLLDGSAFADLPRRGVPVDTFYLPLNENWPVPIDPNFAGGYWADEALSASYRSQFVQSCRRFAEHLRDRGWNDTFFEFYLNGKVYFKERGWSRCSSPWIFDEPTHTQDFWALRWYGLAFREGVDASRGESRMSFRCDISRPQWQRDLLDGLLDVDVVGGAFRRYQRMIQDRKQRWGELTLNYGSSNALEDSNVQPVGWCLDTWALGGDGVLPWQTIGQSESWKNADELSLFYPGEAVGLKDPVPSVRLKAYRQGQQQVEYLSLLCQVLNKPRWLAAQWVRDSLRLKPNVEQKGEDAGRVSYAGLDPVELWRLRVLTGTRLDAAAPAPKRQLVRLSLPRRERPPMPEVGYVSVAPGRTGGNPTAAMQ